MTLMNIFVDNISKEITEDDLLDIFKEYGEVASINVIIDKDGDFSRVFAYVSMRNKKEGKAAIAELNGTTLKGCKLNVGESIT